MTATSENLRIQLAQRGQMTFPKLLRDRYQLQSGDEFTIIDIGGVFILSPKNSEIDRLAQQVRARLEEKDASLEEMLEFLREERENYGAAG